MNKSALYLFSLYLCLSIVSCDNDPNESEIIVEPLEFFQELNISYGDDSDQVFDLYLPANRTLNTKVIILVHGGGWTSGDKSEMDGFKDYILEQLPDYAVVNINYRLADNNTSPHPMQINDITTIVNLLQTKQQEYIISKDLGFIGVSAGAHLSLLWSYAFDIESQVKMACSVVGPTNFTDPAYLNNTDPILQELINLYTEGGDMGYLEEVSPYHQVTASAPPTILFYGGVDPLIPTTQGTDLHDKLNSLGVINEFTLYPTEGHGWVGLNLLDTTLKLRSFIETHMQD